MEVSSADGAVTIRLTEVEAYGDQGEDPGAHSYRGPTKRNASLFGPPQRTYVYLNYGIHRCLNLACNTEGTAGGVLLRSGEVLSGRKLAVQRRGGTDTGPALLSGPGRLGQGLGIDLSMDAHAVHIQDSLAKTAAPSTVSSMPAAHPAAFSKASNASKARHMSGPAQFTLIPPTTAHGLSYVESVESGLRVGVSGRGGGPDFPWRYWIGSAPSVSKYRAGKNLPPL